MVGACADRDCFVPLGRGRLVDVCDSRNSGQWVPSSSALLCSFGSLPAPGGLSHLTSPRALQSRSLEFCVFADNVNSS